MYLLPKACLKHQAMEEIVHAAYELDSCKEVRAIIITGEGNKAFAAGADIKEMAYQTYSEVGLCKHEEPKPPGNNNMQKCAA